MNIEDFLPKYPNVDQTKYGVLNPYDDNFYEAIFRKKEFYENRLDKTEVFPRERGILTKYQKTISRYLSSHTPYDRLLLVHSPGLGKSCSAIGAIEQIISEESIFDGAIILAKGSPLLDNFLRELVEKCTPGQYIPENFSKLTELEKVRRIRKKTKFYQLQTFAKFAKKLKKLTDDNISDLYSNKIVVIDEVHNLRIQTERDKESIETYYQFHRFLHIIKNCKVLLLSGTPMKDSPDEIASVANFLLPLDQQFPTGEDFLQEYTTEQDNVYKIKPEKGLELKEKLKGKISFLREAESSVQKEFIGEKYGNLKHFIVAPNFMSAFQSKGYKSAYDSDKGGKKGVYINSREASLFVYPDGSYGKEGFSKYIKSDKTKSALRTGASVTSFKLSQELREKLIADSHEQILENIRMYSATYADVIKNILETKGNCFIYSSLVKGSAGILFSLLLELFGFGKANGREREKGLRYAILTNKTASATDIRRINNRFNNSDNLHGEFIKVIIGSRAVSEGFSFRNVIFESVNTPHWNYSETAQALARGIRLGSHNDLIKNGENPVVYILQPVSIPKEKYGIPSIDLLMYQTSEDKDISIRNILRLLMETAFDCALNYLQNHIEGKRGTRECDYTTCKYKCDGIDMGLIEDGLAENQLDFSTYQLYYANPKTPLIRRKIEQLFRENIKLDLDSIVKNLQNQFTEEEIKNALFTIQEESTNGEFDYRTFLELYSRTPVKKITNKVEELFRENFRLNLDYITEFVGPNYTQFEILTALRFLINDSVVLTNKYGLPCYLREEKNLFFLVNNLSVTADYYIEYYVKFLHIVSGKNFEDIMSKIYTQSLPKIVRSICEATDMKQFSRLMKTLPIHVQEMFLEASLVAQEKEIIEGKIVRDRVLEFFKSYIKQVDNVVVSTLQPEILRCMTGFDEWKDCDSGYNQLLQNQEVIKQEKMREENKYGIMGKYNPENGAFCIVDFEKEKEAKTKLSEKRPKSDIDRRLKYSGKVCGAGGWKLPELMIIAIKRLKISPPKTFRTEDTKQEMLERIKKEEKISEMFTPEELEDASKNDLRRILYWSTPKKEKGNRGIKPICEALKIWFEKHNLLEIDNQCGVQGKKKIIGGVKKVAKHNFRLESFIPNKDKEKFQNQVKDISKLMGECFDTKKYKPPIDDNTWVLVFSRKKVVGFITVDENDVLWNVCVAKNYRRQGIATEAIKQAVQYICNKRGKEPTLMVDNRNKDVKKLVRMYISFGFIVDHTDARYTHMRHPCNTS